ncbi:MAG: dTMP kinase [Planctomycetota bacterium]
MAPGATHGPRPLFVVLDGIDGCGKTTQAARLAAALHGLRTGAIEGAGAALHLREPGSTPAGEAIRALVLANEPPLGRGALALLFAAARRETLEQLVAPALAAGRGVVIERFHASTFAYQGSRQARAGETAPYDDDALLELLHGWAGAPVPDVELVLDLAPAEAAARADERARGESGSGRDRFEAEGLAFQERVREGLLDYVARVDRARLVDASGTPDEVEARVREAILEAPLAASAVGRSARRAGEGSGA